MEIAKYFSEGCSRESVSFFHKSFEPLKEKLRKTYFDKYRGGREFGDNKSPRTGDFISIVLSEMFYQRLQGRNFIALNGNDSNGLIDRCLSCLEAHGYGYLINGNGSNRNI